MINDRGGKMFKNIKEKDIEVKKLNEVITLSSKILKIAYVLFLILAIYAITLVLEKWGIPRFILTILTIISPLFIGLIFAWLFNPLVTCLQKRKINRVLGTTIVYIVFIVVIYIILSSIIPILSKQLNEFIATMPNIVGTIKGWIDNLFIKFGNGDNPNILAVREELFGIVDELARDITRSIPGTTVNIVTNFFSGLGILLLGAVIGFFMLFNFDNVNKFFLDTIPLKFKKDLKYLTKEIDTTLKQFVKGMFVLSFIIFIFSTLAFTIIGLQAPILFGLFCGITNIIPYIGPYIGGAAAAIVGFVQSPAIGILVIILVAIIQSAESSFVQPLVMSRAVKLHPVTIIVGLLIFGYFYGIGGLILATPIMAVIKILITFLNKKYNFLGFLNNK
jgi:predicted PurR-regulated permease PerM